MYHEDRGEDFNECLTSLVIQCIEIFQQQGKVFKLKNYNINKTIELLDSTLTIAPQTLISWFEVDFPDTAIFLPKSDYCETCFEFHTSLDSLKIQMNLHKVFCNTSIFFLIVC